MKTLALSVTLLAMLAVAILVAIISWLELGDTEITTPGLLAMTAGIVLSIGVGVGLMYLVFKSERRPEANQ